MNELIERAIESVNDLDSVIKRFNTNPTLIDVPPKSLNSGNKIGPHGIPEEIVRHCEIAIESILGAVSGHDGTIHARTSCRPPEWWRDVRRCAEHQRLKDAATKQSLADAVAVLERHVRENTPHTAGLALLIGNLDHKIKSCPSKVGFRSVGNPHSNVLVFFFDPEVNGDVDGAINTRSSARNC